MLHPDVVREVEHGPAAGGAEGLHPALGDPQRLEWSGVLGIPCAEGSDADGVELHVEAQPPVALGHRLILVEVALAGGDEGLAAGLEGALKVY